MSTGHSIFKFALVLLLFNEQCHKYCLSSLRCELNQVLVNWHMGNLHSWGPKFLFLFSFFNVCFLRLTASSFRIICGGKKSSKECGSSILSEMVCIAVKV